MVAITPITAANAVAPRTQPPEIEEKWRRNLAQYVAVCTCCRSQPHLSCSHTVETEVISLLLDGWLNAPPNPAVAMVSECAGCCLALIATLTVNATPWVLQCRYNLEAWPRLINDMNTAAEAKYADEVPGGLHFPTYRRPAIRAAMRELVASRIIHLDAEPGRPDEGLVQWNLHREQWLLPPAIQIAPPNGLSASEVARRMATRPSTSEWRALRELVFERDDYTCVYCGKRGGGLHCDHLVPLSRGGTNNPDNLATACDVCNLSKGRKVLSDWLAEVH